MNISGDCRSYFFCGIGGSGMLPLAVLLHRLGHSVCGSDRSYDQGKTLDKFKALLDLGIVLVAQDGSGMRPDVDYLVVSSAVEDSIPDVKAAKSFGVPIIKRGALLAELFNNAQTKIAVAGTSGKSTVTGMIGTVLSALNLDPTVVNGGQVRNFDDADNALFSSVRKGDGDAFVAEMDESDRSIEHYIPTIAALNNIALDHMGMDELKILFGDYLARAEQSVIANYDDAYVRALCAQCDCDNIIRFSLNDQNADMYAFDITPKTHGIDFSVRYGEDVSPVSLYVPGRHNVSNALCALSACVAAGVGFVESAKALSQFKGIHRRMEYIGTKNGVSVFDDFGHNPDKISASLQSLKEFDGRLIILFQPHGFGPLRLMGQEIVDAFSSYLADGNDLLFMPEVYYAGGTVDRSVTAKDIIQDACDQGVSARWFATRAEILPAILQEAEEGDRIVVMGARDDTLHQFAHDILTQIP
ncbi:MAG: UDP-N-acetylmuramate--L-alanine ligase [Alphaproteobacteria bacterium]